MSGTSDVNARMLKASTRLQIGRLTVIAVGVALAGGAAFLAEISGERVLLVAVLVGLAAATAVITGPISGAIDERVKAARDLEGAHTRLRTYLEAVSVRAREELAAGSLRQNDPFFLDRLVRKGHARESLDSPGLGRDNSEDTSEARLPDRKRELPEIGRLTDFIEPDGPAVVLIGDGGSGKTTSLLLLQIMAADRALRDETAPIPVYIHLKHFAATERGLESILELAAAAAEGLPYDSFRDLWHAPPGSTGRRMLILMDGLNEQHGSPEECRSAIQQLADRRHHSYVIASRPTRDAAGLIASDPRFLAVEIVPLTDDEVARVLRRAGRAALWESMSSALKDLARNPFVLMALVKSMPGGDPPRNVGELYERVIDEHTFEKREPYRGANRYSYEEVKKVVLGTLADRMTSTGVSVIRRTPKLESEIGATLAKIAHASERRQLMPRNWAPEDCIDETVANGILRQAGHELQFFHQTVQEYFAATARTGRDDHGRVVLVVPIDDVVALVPPLIWRHVDTENGATLEPEHRYKLVILMLVGLVNDGSDLVRRISERDPILAARCLQAARHVDDGIVHELFGEWKALSTSTDPRRQLIAAVCVEAAGRADEPLRVAVLDLADNSRYRVRRAAMDALRPLQWTKEDLAFLAARAQPDRAMDSYTQLLIDVSPRDAVTTLASAWRSATAEGRTTIAKAIATIDAATVEAVLLPMASADVHELLTEVDRAREERPSIPTAARLREIMRQSRADADAKAGAATDGELPLLLRDEKNGWVRGAAATAIAARRLAPLLPSLLEALEREDRNTFAFNQLARALYELAGPGTIELLLERVAGSDTVVLQEVTGDWPHDESFASMPPEVRALVRHSDDSVRHRARLSGDRTMVIDADSGDIGYRISAPGLGIIRVEVSGIRVRALRAALEIAGATMLFSPLLTCLTDEDPRVRAVAGEAIGTIKDDRAVSRLAAALAAEANDWVRSVMVQALASIGTPDALTHVIGALARGAVSGAELSHLPSGDDSALDLAVLGAASVAPREECTRLLSALGGRWRARVATGRPIEATADHRAFLVTTALDETEPGSAAAAAALLRWGGSDPGLPAFAEALESPEPSRRLAAIRALMAIQEPGASDLLRATLPDPDFEVRLAGAHAVMVLHDDQFRDAARAVIIELALAELPALLWKRAFDALSELDSFGEVYEVLYERFGAGRYEDVDEGVTRIVQWEDERGPSHRLFVYRELFLSIRGEARVRLKRTDEGLADLEKACLTSDWDAIHVHRASILSQLGRNAEAVIAQRRAVELAPVVAAHHAELGSYAYRDGDYEAAAAALSRAAELDPSDPTIAADLGLAYLASGQEEEAKYAYTRLIGLMDSLTDVRRQPVATAAKKDLVDLLDRQPQLAKHAEPLLADLEARAS